MKSKQVRSWIAVGTVALVLGTTLLLFGRVRAVSGLVQDVAGQPLPGAIVRLRASAYATAAGRDGRFELGGFPPALRVRVTAWVDGYYIAGRTVWPWQRDIQLTLAPYAVPDNPAYAWIPPLVEARSAWEHANIRARLLSTAALAPDTLFFKAAGALALGCQDCHSAVVYDQWAGSAHALGLANPRLATMYNGSDVRGRQSPPTRYGFSRDYGSFPLRPDPNQPYYGPGYKLDFPDTAGNCAACHLPAAAIDEPYSTDPNRVEGVNALGAHCDFCHKVAGVRLDPESGLPYENMPGVLSLVMMRPQPEKQLFFGPYDDVDAGTDTYLPLQRQSQFCAPCHSASFWGVPVYRSFAEWLASPYSEPATGQTCQDCHMKPDGVTTQFAPGRVGQQRDPADIFSHSFPGAADELLLQNAVTMTATAQLEGDQLLVQVTITNDQTGHHVPTDSPLRHLILLVQATDDAGNPLVQLTGPTIPAWGGAGDPAGGYYAGLPGTAYAKILQELWTEVSPTGAYWNPTRIVSDNRIAAFASVITGYTFAAPTGSTARVEVRLLFRRAFIELAALKGWDDLDIVMAHQTVLLRVGQ